MAMGEVRVLRPFKLIALVCLLVALALDVVALLSPAWVTSERGSLSLWEACKRAPDVWHCLSTLRTDDIPWQTWSLLSSLSLSISWVLLADAVLQCYTAASPYLALLCLAGGDGAIRRLTIIVVLGVLLADLDWQVATLVLILTAATITLLSFLASLVSFCLGTPRQYYRVVAVLLLVAVVLQACALILYPIKFIDSSMLKSYHEFNWGYGLGWGSAIFMLGAAILYCLRMDVYQDAYY